MWLVWTLAACVAFGVGATLQKHGMAEKLPRLTLADALRRWRAVLGAMLRNWVWLLGVALNLVGGGCMVLALDAGEISVVQPLANVNVLAAMALGVAALGERLAAVEWAGAGLLFVGAVLLSLAGAPNSAETAAAALNMAAVGGITLGGAALSALLATAGRLTRRGPRLETSLALAAGLLFGLGAVHLTVWLIRLGGAANLASWDGLVGVLGDWPVWGVAAANAVGFVLFQAAFSHGRVAVVAPLTTNAAVLLPVASGFWAFGEPAGALKLAGVAVVLAGTGLLLARRADPPAP